MLPWYEADPERFERELSALGAADIAYKVDEEFRARGQLRLELVFPYKDKLYELVADYPDLFPYFQPEVLAPNERFVRHQHPDGGNLCLLGRSSDQWHVDDTVADVLLELFPRIVDYSETKDSSAIATLEEPQGEPVSEYFNSTAALGSFILIDSRWSVPPNVDRGEMLIWHFDVPSSSAPMGVPQGIVAQVTDAQGNELASWEGPRPKRYVHTLHARWVRVDPPPIGTIGDLVGRLDAAQRAFLWAKRPSLRKNQSRVGAVLFKEEIGQFRFADGWVFIQEYVHAERNKVYERSFPLRTFRCGENDLAARMPSVRALATKEIVIVGLGALGSFAAIELARNGAARLSLVDFDFMEPSTARRWAVGWPAFGEAKPNALKTRIEADYPWTHVEPIVEKIGASFRRDANVSQKDITASLIASHDLVIDCSAELAVNHYLSAACGVNSTPYIVANATPGGWGGMVAQFAPGRKKACWYCLRDDLYGDAPTIELPPADPEGFRQPPGCASRTFTGSSFDLQEVVLELVRVACGLVSAGAGYPATDWDVGILRLRNQDRTRTPPQWTGRTIKPRIGCNCLTS